MKVSPQTLCITILNFSTFHHTNHCLSITSFSHTIPRCMSISLHATLNPFPSDNPLLENTQRPGSWEAYIPLPQTVAGANFKGIFYFFALVKLNIIFVVISCYCKSRLRNISHHEFYPMIQLV